MSKRHTPGPWKVRHGFDDDTYEVYPTRGRRPEIGEWAAIATVEKDVGKGESGRANARLIAAAPDLLAAITELRQAIKTIEPIETSLATIEKVLEAMVVADAAIAKATGSAS